MVDDGLGGNTSYRRDNVVWRQSLGLALCDKCVSNGVPEHLTSCGLWWFEAEVWESLQELVHHLLIYCPCSTHLAVLVILALSVGKIPHCRINEDVPRAGVKIEKVGIQFAVLVRRNEADICYTADILTCSELGRVVKEQCVKKGDQGSALPTGCLVRNPEIGDRCDSCSRREE